jgi:tetratricopeptide (TPR) repeat protein
MPRALSAWIVALTLAGSAAAGPANGGTQAADLDAKIAATYRAAYSLDQDQAFALARSAVSSAPGESRAHRTLAAVLWIDIIFRRGAVTVDHYLGGVTRSQLTLPKPPAAGDAEFKQELDRAIELAERRLDANPRDVQAKYDLGAAYGLQASYYASVEGSMTSAFLSARRAFDAQEEVLSLEPHRLAAGVVVGTYRYVISGLSLPSRMLAYMAGFGGGKEKGISILETAARDAGARVEAKTALALIYSREGRHRDAERLLAELAAEFPRNRLFVLEQGAAAIRAGRNAEAEAILTRGLDALHADLRPKIPGERALWLYKRGLARFAQNHRPEATTDLDAALRSGPVEWVRGRILLTQGKIADLAGRRDEAVAAYRVARDIGLKTNDPGSAAEAGRLIRQPFSRRPNP